MALFCNTFGLVTTCSILPTLITNELFSLQQQLYGLSMCNTVKPLFGKKALDQSFIAIINDNCVHAYYLHVKHSERQTTKTLEGELNFIPSITKVALFLFSLLIH